MNYAKSNGHLFVENLFGKDLAKDQLERTLLEGGAERKILFMQGMDIDRKRCVMVEEVAMSLGFQVEIRMYQRMIRPNFETIKRFIQETIETNALQEVDAIIGIYDGGAVPSMVAKHVINKSRRRSSDREISVYPMRLRTTKNDGMCSNSQDNSVDLEYFVEPPLVSDPHFLIVEDIVSYGKTLEKAIGIVDNLYRGRGVTPKTTVLSLVFNRERYLIGGMDSPKNFHYAIETKDRDWVVFPWEYDDGKRGIFL
jgi:hypoxanthine phosphoribosyltransferase